MCRHPLTTNTVVPRETNDHLDHYLDDLADGIVHDNDNDHDDDDSDMGDDIFVDDAFLDIDSIIEEPLDADGVDAMTQRLASPLSCSLDDLHEFFNDHTVADDESVLAESFAQQQFWAYEDRHGGDGEDNGTWGDALFEGDDDWDIYNELGWDSARMRDSLSQIDILLERLRV